MAHKKARKKFTKCFEKLMYEKIGGDNAGEYKEHILRKIDDMDVTDLGSYVMLGIFTSECLEDSWIEEFMNACKEASDV